MASSRRVDCRPRPPLTMESRSGGRGAASCEGLAVLGGGPWRVSGPSPAASLCPWTACLGSALRGRVECSAGKDALPRIAPSRSDTPDTQPCASRHAADDQGQGTRSRRRGGGRGRRERRQLPRWKAKAATKRQLHRPPQHGSAGMYRSVKRTTGGAMETPPTVADQRRLPSRRKGTRGRGKALGS